MDHRWFQFRFRFQVTEDHPPRWWIDIAVFDSVIRYVVQDMEEKLALWRIHRRAGPDASGHQLTFLAYTDKNTADLIHKKIEGSEVVQALRDGGLIREYIVDQEDTDRLRLVEGTSDQSWAMEIQKAWPHFIMGASKMCLVLLDELKVGSDPPNPKGGATALETYYEDLSGRLNESWQQHGSDAYLHHLNALFGYAPVLLKPRKIFGALVTL